MHVCVCNSMGTCIEISNGICMSGHIRKRLAATAAGKREGVGACSPFAVPALSILSRASMCSGVVPQHPPSMLTSLFSTKTSRDLAKLSGLGDFCNTICWSGEAWARGSGHGSGERTRGTGTGSGRRLGGGEREARKAGKGEAQPKLRIASAERLSCTTRGEP